MNSGMSWQKRSYWLTPLLNATLGKRLTSIQWSTSARQSIIDYARQVGMNTKNDSMRRYEMNVVYFGRMDRAFVYPRTSYSGQTKCNPAIRCFRRTLTTNYGERDIIDAARLGELQQYRNAAACWALMQGRHSRRKKAVGAVEAEIEGWWEGR